VLLVEQSSGAGQERVRGGDVPGYYRLAVAAERRLGCEQRGLLGGQRVGDALGAAGVRLAVLGVEELDKVLACDEVRNRIFERVRQLRRGRSPLLGGRLVVW
jgi:hypothetical protein